MKRRPPPSIPVPALFLALGACALVIAGALGALWAHRLLTRDAVPGVVVENDKRCRKGGCRYRPVVEYVVDGGKYRLIGEVGNSSPLFEVGEPVGVRVSPADPRDARIDHWLENAFGPLLGLFFGVVFGGIGLALHHKELRHG